jgi:hypothetical protein
MKTHCTRGKDIIPLRPFEGNRKTGLSRFQLDAISMGFFIVTAILFINSIELYSVTAISKCSSKDCVTFQLPHISQEFSFR